MTQEPPMPSDFDCLAHGTDYQACPSCWRNQRDALTAANAALREEARVANALFFKMQAHAVRLEEENERLRQFRVFWEPQLEKAQSLMQENERLRARLDKIDRKKRELYWPNDPPQHRQ